MANPTPNDKINEQPQRPLWKVEWLKEGYDTVVDRKHQESLLGNTSTNSQNLYYDPNLHYPHLLVLTKLRELTDEDRHLATKRQVWKPKQNILPPRNSGTKR